MAGSDYLQPIRCPIVISETVHFTERSNVGIIPSHCKIERVFDISESFRARQLKVHVLETVRFNGINFVRANNVKEEGYM